MGTNYQIVNGVPMGAGADLYAEAMATQEAHKVANIEHQANVSGNAIIRHVSTKPKTASRAYQWYATKQDLIDRGFPTVDGIPTPVTQKQATQQGFSSSADPNKRSKNYTKFYNDTYNNYSKQSTQQVLDRQKIYRLITGKPTFAYHGCQYIDGQAVCPNWSRLGKLSKGTHTRNQKLIGQTPVETSKTMIEGLPIPPTIIIPPPIVISPPTPDPEPVETASKAGLIIGIAVIAFVIYFLIRRGK